MFIFAVRFLVSCKRKKTLEIQILKEMSALTCRMMACVEVIYSEHLRDGFKTQLYSIAYIDSWTFIEGQRKGKIEGRNLGLSCW